MLWVLRLLISKTQVAMINFIKYSTLPVVLSICLGTVTAQDGFIKVSENSRLHYRIAGTGADTVVVPDGAWQFPYYKKFGTGVVYIIYDVGSRGYSDKTPSVGIMHDVEDLEAVRKHFKIKKMNVIGWSYLGGVAALYASKYPEFTRSVILVGPIPLRAGEEFDAYVKSTVERRSKLLDDELEKLKASGTHKDEPEAYCRKFYEATIYAIIFKSNNAKNLAVNVPCDCENEQPENIGALIQKIFADLGKWDWGGQLQSFKASTLVVHGVSDNIPIESSKAWVSINENSKLLTFSSSGHLPFAEEPKLYFQSIRDFLSALK